ncbi:hypothetical protein [uncultured Campylobacter sp.]|uniref:hypothetical protein n=1 Tax=uncultured Campylobacter sp. TaxID=218934 RepID=UPI002603311A|nr:hypothetical protein [uncultured Campylobacter sp.]
MAIDGVKIIDSDDGYDIYLTITERYKDGEDVETILQDVLAQAENFCTDELYSEIYWTALAYSLWKIGFLNDEIREKALAIIKGGASQMWNKVFEKSQKSRQKALDKLALQLKSENPRPLKRPKISKQKTPYFEEGDVLSIQMQQGYGVCFVSAVGQRKLEYHLACTRVLQKEPPGMDDFLKSKIASSKNGGFLRVDRWFNHKDLKELLPYLKKIRKVKFAPFKLGELSPAKELEDFYNKITADPKIWGFRLIDTARFVEAVIEDTDKSVAR